MKSFPNPLTPSEEKYYIRKYTEGDLEAKHILIERNLRLVAHVIKKYQNSEEDPEDLISIGTIGLIKAVVTFNPDKGNRLAAYASRCIENEILMYLRSKKKAAKEISLYEPIGTDREGNEIKLYDIIETDEEEVAEKIHLKENIQTLYEKVEKELSQRLSAAEIAKRQKYRRIIFISGTDSARAPMAAEMLRHEDLAQEYVIDSRGLVVLFPEPANQKAEAIMKSAQMTLENHVSRQLEPETLVEDTLVLTIEEAEKNKILSEYGTKANVYTLNEFVGSDGEIPNPYGKPLTAYGECYEILRELIKELAEKLNYIAEEE